jgi:hypothetical protein
MTNRAQELAEELVGTKSDLDDVAERHETDNWQLLSDLKDYALKCDTCGLWCDPEEMDTTDGDCTCEECVENA